MNELRTAELVLDQIDAEVARWYVHDGQLSEEPLDRPLSATGRELRKRRKKAVKELEKLGGKDLWPSVLREPSNAQREGWKRKQERA